VVVGAGDAGTGVQVIAALAGQAVGAVAVLTVGGE